MSYLILLDITRFYVYHGFMNITLPPNYNSLAGALVALFGNSVVIAETDVNHVMSMIESEIFEAIEELAEYDPLKIDKVDLFADDGDEDMEAENEEDED